jgi:O-antigen ligase
MVIVVVTDLIASRAVVFAALFLICLVATLLTGSRAGSLATFAALSAMVAGLIIRSARQRRTRIVVSIVACFLVIFFAEILSGGALMERLAKGFANDGRQEVWASTLQGIPAHAWTGSGLGSFSDIFPSLQSEAVGYAGTWEHAHSTPLELALTIGLPATAVVLAAWLWLFAAHLRGVLAARRSYAIPMLGLAALLLVSIHGCVDFSLQVPGFAIPFAVLVGSTLGYSTRRELVRNSRVADGGTSAYGGVSALRIG